MKSIIFVILLTSLLVDGGGNQVQCREKNLDLIIAMDGSITIGYIDFERQIDLFSSIISKLPIGESLMRVGIIQFSDSWSTNVEMGLGEHQGTDSVVKFLKAIRYSVGYFTLTGKALELAYSQFFGVNGRHGVEKILVIITDGRPRDIPTFNYQLKLLKDKDVRIISIAAGRSYPQIEEHKYITRSMATSFQNSFKLLYKNLGDKIDAITNAICGSKPPTPSGESIQKKCFQEKKDVVFAIDGSRHISEETFKKAISAVSMITEGLDIAPTLVHVALIQYSDFLNTRIEFDLNQYTKMYKVNQSLNSVVQAKGLEADLGNALNIIDSEIFSDDRLSAEDALVLLMTANVKSKEAVEEGITRLREKGVHTVVIVLGEMSEQSDEFYERLVAHPSDISHIDNVTPRHILGDLARTVCRKVVCNDEEEEEEQPDCVQRKQDIIFMLDGARSMDKYFKKSKRFFTKIIKKLNIAVSNIHVGFVMFDSVIRKGPSFKLGKLKFERDIRDRINRARQYRYRPRVPSLDRGLKVINDQIFNTASGGHREDARDLIFIATLGQTYRRHKVQQEVERLKQKGVKVAVLDVGYKKPIQTYQNVLQDLASGPREVYPLDFKRLSTTAQSLLDVECKVQEKTVLPTCFERKRNVLFMLDSSSGLTNDQAANFRRFISNITEKLYSNPSNIAIGVLQYSDSSRVSLELPVRRRPLQSTLRVISNIRLIKGQRNRLGIALKMVHKRIFRHGQETGSDQNVIILLTHSQVANHKKAFRMAEKLKQKGVQLVTVVVHTKKMASGINDQYKVLATSSSTTHAIDYNHLLGYANEIVLNLCQLNECPEDATKKCSPKKQDIFMVVDSSRSIGRDIYPQLVRFIKRFVNKLDVAPDLTNLGIIQASDTEKTEFEMKLNQYNNIKDINNIIQDMKYHYGKVSLIGRAIETALRDNLFNGSSERSDAENVLMVFTDGVFHDEPLAKEMVSELKQRGVRVVMVGLGAQSRLPSSKLVLEHMATTPTDVYLINLDGNFLTIEDELDEVVQHVRKLDCINKYKAPILCSPEKVDIFVMIDGSRSVGQKNFKKVEEFLQKLASEFDIGKDMAHMGLMQYGAIDETRIEFHMDTFDTNKKVNAAIKNVTYLNSHMTETGKALEVVNREIFSGKNGDRPDGQDILILFTDGSAHDKSTAYRVADEMKRRGVRIVGIGAGSEVKKFFNQLQRISSGPENAHMSDFNELAGVVEDFLDVVCT